METSISACGKCQSEFQPGDNFCQECGGSIVALDQLNDKKDIPRQAILTCLNCGSQHEGLSRYCASCGSLMSDMGVYTTTVKAVTIAESVARDGQANGEPALGRRHVKGLLLDSPLLQRSARPEKFQGKPPYRTPALAHTIVDLAPGILLLAFFALVVFWFIDYDRDRSPTAVRALFLQAQATHAAKRVDQTIQVMERLSTVRTGNMSAEERALMNEALYLRAGLNGALGKERPAMLDLLHITPDFARYSDVRAKIGEYGAIAEKSSPQEDNAKAVSDRDFERALAAGTGHVVPKASAVTSLISNQEKPPGPEASTRTIVDRSGNAERARGLATRFQAQPPAGASTGTAPDSPSDSSGSQSSGQQSSSLQSHDSPSSALQSPAQRSPASQSSSLTPPATQSSLPITNANHPAEAAATARNGGASGAGARTKWHYCDADVARYNKLLADYFSSARPAARRAGLTDEEHGTETVNREPPSLKEWLDQGKPNF